MTFIHGSTHSSSLSTVRLVGSCCTWEPVGNWVNAGQKFWGSHAHGASVVFRTPEKTQSLPQPLGTEFTIKIFCLKLAFEHILLPHYFPEAVFFLKDFDSSSLIARQQLGCRTARSAGSTALPSFLTQTLPSATAVAASFQPRGGCTEAIGEVILIYIFNSLKCLDACKRHYINQLITVSEVSQPIRIQFSLMRDK